MANTELNQKIIKSIQSDLEKLVAQQQFTFDPPDSLRSNTPRTCICALMQNIDTGEQAYRPEKLLARDGSTVKVIDNPGWEPVTLKVIEIDLHLTTETGG